jgi:hypothetical protein
MPDEDEKGAPDLSALTTKVTELSAALEKANAALTERDTKISTLEGSTGGLKTANGQLTTKVTDLETQLAQQTQAVQTQAGELTNWTTKFEQLTQAQATLAADAASKAKQLELYALIAAKPEYHPLVGDVGKIAGLIKPDAPSAEIEALFQSMAAGRQSSAAAALTGYRAGETLPAGQIPGAAAGAALPTDPKVAFAEYQQLAGATTPEQLTRRAQLFEVISTAEFTGSSGQQQN